MTIVQHFSFTVIKFQIFKLRRQKWTVVVVMVVMMTMVMTTTQK